MKLSARNQLKGRIVERKKGATTAHIRIDIGGQIVTASITNESADELKLAAPLGIVYATDAKVEPGVKIIGTFPADTHPPIIYPVAATTTAKPEANDYLAYLRSSAAKAVLEKYGFTYLIR